MTWPTLFLAFLAAARATSFRFAETDSRFLCEEFLRMSALFQPDRIPPIDCEDDWESDRVSDSVRLEPRLFSRRRDESKCRTELVLVMAYQLRPARLHTA